MEPTHCSKTQSEDSVGWGGRILSRLRSRSNQLQTQHSSRIQIKTIPLRRYTRNSQRHGGAATAPDDAHRPGRDLRQGGFPPSARWCRRRRATRSAFSRHGRTARRVPRYPCRCSEIELTIGESSRRLVSPTRPRAAFPNMQPWSLMEEWPMSPRVIALAIELDMSNVR